MASTTRTGVHHGWRPARSPIGPPIPRLSAEVIGSSRVGWTTGSGSSLPESVTTRALAAPSAACSKRGPALPARSGRSTSGRSRSGRSRSGRSTSGALEVGALDVGGALEVGALEGGADVRWVGRGVKVGSGAWSVCFAGTLAAGGNFSIGSPVRSSFITAAQVAVG